MKDLVSERLVLSGVLKYGRDSFLDVSDLVDEFVFMDDTNRIIWLCLKHTFDKTEINNITFPMVLSAAVDIGFGNVFEKTSELNHLRAVIAAPIGRDEIRNIGKKLKKLFIIREASQKLGEAREQLNALTGNETLTTIVNTIEEPVLNFSLSIKGIDDNYNPQLIGEGIDTHISMLEENIVDIKGVPTGFPYYDKMIGGGMRKGAISVVAARPKRGKSFFSLCVALHVAGKLNVPVLLLDSEMALEDNNNRMLSNLTGIILDEIETGKYNLSEEKKSSIKKAAQYIKKIPFFLHNVVGQTPEQITSLIRRWLVRHVKFGPDGLANNCVVIYDYLKITDPKQTEDKSEWEVMGYMMNALHQAGRKYGYPTLAMVQLNKDHDVAQSDRIRWLCSNLSFLLDTTDEERAALPRTLKCNRKMKFEVARHAKEDSFDDGNFLCYSMRGEIGRLIELGPSSEITKEGFTVSSEPVQF